MRRVDRSRLAGIAIAAFFAACSRAPSAPESPPASRGLDLGALRNAEFSLDYIPGGKIRLADGKFENPAERTTVQLTMTAVGDLDGDGLEDAAVVVVSSTGGSGVFEELVAMLNQGGRPVPVAHTLLGDRARIQSLQIQDGAIQVQMTTHGPDDPMCCPTLEVVRIFKVTGGELTEQSPDGLQNPAPEPEPSQ